MASILLFIAGIALGFYIKGTITKSTHTVSGNFASMPKEDLSEIREESREALTERTEERKTRILYLMDKEKVHERELRACNVADIHKGITSENVEKLLGVSNGTARKYLNELESEGKVEQVGKSGKGVYYVLKA